MSDIRETEQLALCFCLFLSACILEVLFCYLLMWSSVRVRVHMWLSQQNSAVTCVRVCVFSFLCLVIVIQLSPAPAPSQRAGIIQSIALSATAPFCTLLVSNNSFQPCCYTFTVVSSMCWCRTFPVSQRKTRLGRKVSIFFRLKVISILTFFINKLVWY